MRRRSTTSWNSMGPSMSDHAMPDGFDQMWSDLTPLGRSGTSGGYFRQPFSAAERECHAWFVEQCRARELRLEHDGNGNTVGWWEPEGGGRVRHDSAAVDVESGPKRAGPSVLTGSHLDSVL